MFNKESRLVKPQTISSTLQKVLDTVNHKLGANFNSILINKYKDKNTALGWHQDNETCVVQQEAIATLSVGAVRRFQITDSKEVAGRTELVERELTKNSVLTM